METNGKCSGQHWPHADTITLSTPVVVSVVQREARKLVSKIKLQSLIIMIYLLGNTRD